jgi:hypothetical protein
MHAGGEGGTHRCSKSLHWPSHSGSALTFVEPMYLPRTGRARAAAPAARQWADVGSNGRSDRKSPRMHARTPACA